VSPSVESSQHSISHKTASATIKMTGQSPSTAGRSVFRKHAQSGFRRISRGQTPDAAASTVLAGGNRPPMMSAVTATAGGVQHHHQRRPMWKRTTKINGEKTWTAIYDYEAKDEDELTLKRGTEVRVLSKAKRVSGGKGWWTGEVNNRVGVFPSTYVVEISKEGPSSRAQQGSPGISGIGGAVPGTSSLTLATSKFQLTKALRPPEIDYRELEKKEMIGHGAFGKVYRSIFRGEEVYIILAFSMYRML